MSLDSSLSVSLPWKCTKTFSIQNEEGRKKKISIKTEKRGGLIDKTKYSVRIERTNEN